MTGALIVSAAKSFGRRQRLLPWAATALGPHGKHHAWGSRACIVHCTPVCFRPLGIRAPQVGLPPQGERSVE